MLGAQLSWCDGELDNGCLQEQSCLEVNNGWVSEGYCVSLSFRDTNFFSPVFPPYAKVWLVLSVLSSPQLTKRLECSLLVLKPQGVTAHFFLAFILPMRT